MTVIHPHITETARRIATKYNQACGQSLSGGQLVFGPDGSGGAWYSAGAYGFEPDSIVISVTHHRTTARQIQDMLDGRTDGSLMDIDLLDAIDWTDRDQLHALLAAMSTDDDPVYGRHNRPAIVDGYRIVRDSQPMTAWQVCVEVETALAAAS